MAGNFAKEANFKEGIEFLGTAVLVADDVVLFTDSEEKEVAILDQEYEAKSA